LGAGWRSSAAGSIFRSAARLIFEASGIGRAADDTKRLSVYLGDVRARLLRLGRFRIDPVKLDLILAGVLAVGSGLEAWFENATGQERLVVAIAGPLMASTVAVRRRYPAAAGIAAASIANIVAIAWKPPNTVSFGIAWLCSLYALTVWTTPRLFAIGATVLALPPIVAVAIRGEPKGGVSFTAITLVVMLLVRRVVGDRERRAQIAERERDVVAREAVFEERARIARELHDVIAHHVSMIVLQAGAERRVLDDANASTREVLETVERTGRSALTDCVPARPQRELRASYANAGGRPSRRAAGGR
jgi:signal transduction histidine kinase